MHQGIPGFSRILEKTGYVGFSKLQSGKKYNKTNSEAEDGQEASECYPHISQA